MNILRIVYDWPDENTITDGLAPAPYELSLAQAQLGNKIIVLCGNLNGKNLKAKKFKYNLLEDKITVYNLPRALSGFGPFLTTSIFVPFFYFYLKSKHKIDLIHNHGHLGVWLMLIKFIAKSVDKTPVIGHYHITAKGREEALKSQKQKITGLTASFEYPIHKLSDFLMSKVARHIIVVSSNIALELIKYYKVPSEKITLLESAVDTVRFSKNGNKINFGFEENAIIIGNGGRLSKRKNIDILIRAIALLPDNYKLVLWGSWDEELKVKMMEYISAKNLWSRIKYAGPVNYFDVDKYYRAVNLFVLPSSYEGLPKVVIEALSCGCKVLASGFTIIQTIPDLNLIDANTLTSESLANDIVKAVGLNENYNETKNILEESYSWKSKAEFLEKIYDRYV